jgi:hypothetical protein
MVRMFEEVATTKRAFAGRVDVPRRNEPELDAMVSIAVEEDHVRFASPPKEPPLLYCICVFEPPGVPPLPQVVVATLPAAFTVRQFDPEVPSPVMVRFVVVALPLMVSPPKVGMLVIPMLCGKLKLMMFGELVATVI